MRNIPPRGTNAIIAKTNPMNEARTTLNESFRNTNPHD
jgi:hypothetical protein